jgi:UDP-glucose 4-epimerase
MKVFVTGGAGFIGSHLIDLLLREGNQVVAIDNFSLGKKENIQHLESHSNFQFQELDILDKERFISFFNSTKPDLVYHMAANSDISISHKKPETDLEKTFLTTYNTLDAMRLSGVTKIFFASTSAVYGDVPIRIREDHGPLLPESHYGAAKLASEAILSSFSVNYGVQVWIARFPNVVGGRATHGAIYDFILKVKKNPDLLEVLGNGKQEKPYLYVKDLVEAMNFIQTNSKERFNVYNIGLDTKTKVSEIAEMVVELSGNKAKIHYTGGDKGWIGDIPKFEYDTSKLESLGWKAKRTSADSVRQAILDNL